jgi:hypothetical protein
MPDDLRDRWSAFIGATEQPLFDPPQQESDGEQQQTDTIEQPQII